MSKIHQTHLASASPLPAEELLASGVGEVPRLAAAGAVSVDHIAMQQFVTSLLSIATQTDDCTYKHCKSTNMS